MRIRSLAAALCGIVVIGCSQASSSHDELGRDHPQLPEPRGRSAAEAEGHRPSPRPTSPEVTEPPASPSTSTPEHRIGIVSILDYGPDPADTPWSSCQVGLTSGIRCPEPRTLGEYYAEGACRKLMNGDLIPSRPGREEVWGCGADCDHAPDEHPVVVVASEGEPLAAFGTGNDMACGSTVTIRGRTLHLRGGGEDGEYRARYRWRQDRFQALHR